MKQVWNWEIIQRGDGRLAVLVGKLVGLPPVS